MDLTHLFYFVDSFCVFFDRKSLLPPSSSSLYSSEIITILLLYQYHQHKNFKVFYTQHALVYLKKDFPGLPSYSRFIELIPSVSSPLLALFRALSGSCTGTSFIDSSLLRVCQPVRAPRHKVFSEFAAWGRNTKGWHFGFKLHLVINEFRVITNFTLTPANVDDRKPVRELLRGMFGKVYGDKGYISKELFESLLREGIHLVTRLKKGMKEALLTKEDARGLYERSKIETVLGQLKNRFEIEQTRHRSPRNAMIHIITALISYNLFSSHLSLAPEPYDFTAFFSRAA
jgi:IS5 family transposase